MGALVVVWAPLSLTCGVTASRCNVQFTTHLLLQHTTLLPASCNGLIMENVWRTELQSPEFKDNMLRCSCCRTGFILLPDMVQ